MTVFRGERPAPRRPQVSEWSVRDFKALEHAALPLEPLNVLVGANSSGKSSLIQSMLLLAQSTEDELILNGPLVRLGESGDVIRGGAHGMTLGFVVPAPRDEGQSDLAFELTLSEAPEGGLRMTEFSVAEENVTRFYATCERVSAGTRDIVDPKSRFGETLLRVRIIDDKPAPPWTFLSCRSLYPEALIFRRTRKGVLAELRRNYSARSLQEDPEKAFEIAEMLHREEREHRVPAGRLSSKQQQGSGAFGSLSSLLDVSSKELDALYREYVDSLPLEEWVPRPLGRFAYAWAGTAKRNGAETGTDARFQSTARTLSYGIEGLRTFREAIRYLGPLREEPQVVSPSGARYRSLPAGPKGEYTADLLARTRKRQVRFHDWRRRVRVEKVPDAVTLWTTYLGVGDKVTVEDQGKLGRGLRISVNGVERDLTMIGVGASQVIPVLTTVLAAEPNSVILLEQPELHLHPAVQSRLADFFLWARPDLQIVVETHSEYLVTRLRRRVAEQAAPARHIAVLFAEQDKGNSEFRRLHMSGLGDFSDWPKGFFDTQDEEGRALVLAVREAMARKSAR